MCLPDLGITYRCIPSRKDGESEKRIIAIFFLIKFNVADFRFVVSKKGGARCAPYPLVAVFVVAVFVGCASHTNLLSFSLSQ
jgi:hypothetical protein